MPTNFPHGLTSYGIPLPTSGAFPSNGYTHWFVHGNLGNDGNTGTSWDAALKTMARAFELIGSGDVIHLLGNIREQLVTPVGIFDVTIVGEGTVLRHADSFATNSGWRAAATWRAPSSPTSGQALLRIQQQGWQILNILWAGFTTGTPASIELVRNADSGDDERDASHTRIAGCRFAGGSIGIRLGFASYTENLFDNHIEGNIFNDCVTAIKLTAGGAYRQLIRDNVFEANTNHIVAALTQSTIWDNIFQDHTTDAINLTSGGGLNVITKNYLSGTYSSVGGYTRSNANDEWAGNFNTLSGGITVSDPA